VPYRALAVRIIALAIRDLVTHEEADAEYASARAFLSGSGLLLHWCELAGIDPKVLTRVSGFAGGRVLAVAAFRYAGGVAPSPGHTAPAVRSTPEGDEACDA